VALVVGTNLYTEALAARGRALVDDVLEKLDAEKIAACLSESGGRVADEGQTGHGLRRLGR